MAKPRSLMGNELDRTKRLVDKGVRATWSMTRFSLEAGAVAAIGTIEFLTSSNRAKDMEQQSTLKTQLGEAENRRTETLLGLMNRFRDITTKDGKLNLDAMNQTGWNEFVCGAATVMLLEHYICDDVDDILKRSGARIGAQPGQDQTIAAMEEGERQLATSAQSSLDAARENAPLPSSS